MSNEFLINLRNEVNKIVRQNSFKINVADSFDAIKSATYENGDVVFCTENNKTYTICTSELIEIQSSNKDNKEKELKQFECTSCGSHSYKRINENVVKCLYCDSMYYFN